MADSSEAMRSAFSSRAFDELEIFTRHNRFD